MNLYKTITIHLQKKLENINDALFLSKHYFISQNLFLNNYNKSLIKFHIAIMGNKSLNIFYNCCK